MSSEVSLSTTTPALVVNGTTPAVDNFRRNPWSFWWGNTSKLFQPSAPTYQQLHYGVRIWHLHWSWHLLQGGTHSVVGLSQDGVALMLYFHTSLNMTLLLDYTQGPGRFFPSMTWQDMKWQDTHHPVSSSWYMVLPFFLSCWAKKNTHIYIFLYCFSKDLSLCQGKYCLEAICRNFQGGFLHILYLRTDWKESTVRPWCLHRDILECQSIPWLWVHTSINTETFWCLVISVLSFQLVKQKTSYLQWILRTPSSPCWSQKVLGLIPRETTCLVLARGSLVTAYLLLTGINIVQHYFYLFYYRCHNQNVCPGYKCNSNHLSDVDWSQNIFVIYIL